MTLPLTPKERRAAADAAASRALAASLETRNVTRAQLAADCDVPEQHARAWADPDVDRNISVARASCAPQMVRDDLAGFIAGPSRAVVILPAEGRIVDDMRSAARIAQGGGAVLEGLLDAISEGITSGRAAALLPRVREQIRNLCSLELSLQAVERQQCRPVASIAGGRKG